MTLVVGSIQTRTSQNTTKRPHPRSYFHFTGLHIDEGEEVCDQFLRDQRRRETASV
jgi:hypothetical protein